MSPDIAVLGTLALGIYALTRLREHTRLGGLLFGTALGATFMAGGLGPVLMLALCFAVLCLTSPQWRPPSLWAGVLVAAIAAAPWLIAWPAALWQAQPELAREFWRTQFSSLLGIFNKQYDPFYFVRILAWYAWPSVPIILARLWHERAHMLRQSELRMPLIVFAVFLFSLSIGDDMSDTAALPLLLPLALIGAASVDALRRAVASALDWFGMMTFGLFTGLVWLAWIAGQLGWPVRVARELDRLAPGVEVEFGVGKVLFAAVLTILWIAIIAHARRSNRRAIVNWTAGMTIFWLLLMTLWLPVIDEARSYRATMLSLRSALPSQHTCVSGEGFTLSQRALFDYLIGLRLRPVDSVRAAACNHLLIVSDRDRVPALGAGWHEIWRGTRPSDARQLLLRLYQHNAKPG
jgi:4-amino-4-deoxy-L-arabinose transferase-like glycosyltransferase